MKSTIIYSCLLALLLTLSNVCKGQTYVSDTKHKKEYDKIKEVLTNEDKGLHKSFFSIPDIIENNKENKLNLTKLLDLVSIKNDDFTNFKYYLIPFISKIDTYNKNIIKKATNESNFSLQKNEQKIIKDLYTKIYNSPLPMDKYIIKKYAILGCDTTFIKKLTADTTTIAKKHPSFPIKSVTLPTASAPYKTEKENERQIVEKLNNKIEALLDSVLLDSEELFLTKEEENMIGNNFLLTGLHQCFSYLLIKEQKKAQDIFHQLYEEYLTTLYSEHPLEKAYINHYESNYEINVEILIKLNIYFNFDKLSNRWTTSLWGKVIPIPANFSNTFLTPLTGKHPNKKDYDPNKDTTGYVKLKKRLYEHWKGIVNVINYKYNNIYEAKYSIDTLKKVSIDTYLQGIIDGKTDNLTNDYQKYGILLAGRMCELYKLYLFKIDYCTMAKDKTDSHAFHPLYTGKSQISYLPNTEEQYGFDENYCNQLREMIYDNCKIKNQYYSLPLKTVNNIYTWAMMGNPSTNPANKDKWLAENVLPTTEEQKEQAEIENIGGGGFVLTEDSSPEEIAEYISFINDNFDSLKNHATIKTFKDILTIRAAIISNPEKFGFLLKNGELKGNIGEIPITINEADETIEIKIDRTKYELMCNTNPKTKDREYNLNPTINGILGIQIKIEEDSLGEQFLETVIYRDKNNKKVITIENNPSEGIIAVRDNLGTQITNAKDPKNPNSNKNIFEIMIKAVEEGLFETGNLPIKLITASKMSIDAERVAKYYKDKHCTGANQTCCIPIEVEIKNYNDLAAKMFFGSRKYFIPTKEWRNNYSVSIDVLYNLFVKFLIKFGGENNVTILLQGQANSSPNNTINIKELGVGFDSDIYTKYSVTTTDGTFRIVKGQNKDNLPDLRTVFVREKMKDYYSQKDRDIGKKIILFKGNVVNTGKIDDEKFRKVTMVIMIDLCKAKEFYDKCQECKKQGSKSRECKECK